MSLAVKHALLTRNVSHLTFPDEVQEVKAPENARAQGPENRITTLDIAPPEDSVKEAVDRIAQAKRPLIIMGHGARKHKEAIVEFAEFLNAAVVTTFKGKGPHFGSPFPWEGVF